MEKLSKDFEIPAKNHSDEAQRRWRLAVSVVQNPRRRFRMVVDLAKRKESRNKITKIQEKFRIAFYVQKAALQYLDVSFEKYQPSEKFRQAGFEIDTAELSSMVSSRNFNYLKGFYGVEGIARRLGVSLDEGICTITSNRPSTDDRKELFGSNRYENMPRKSFWSFAWDALHDITRIILIFFSIVSMVIGTATEEWPEVMYDGLGVFLCVLFVVMLMTIIDRKLYLHFLDWGDQKRRIPVTRDRVKDNTSIYDLLVGDVVHLSAGDRVPADGIFIHGNNLLVDESRLTGKGEQVNVNEKNPFLFSGTNVVDGSGKMLVTTVGMRTVCGKLMKTLSEGGDDETPLQVKLNGVATIIGKISLGFSVLTFIVLTVRFLVEKALRNEFLDWSSSDALKLLDYFAIAVTIIVVAVPERLPLAVTLILAFAMKQLKNDKALVRHLAACETLGSATCICTDKTGTLTTNHMVVDKIWLCGKAKEIKDSESGDILSSGISEKVLTVLLQAIFQNTRSGVVKGKDGKNSISGTPTESALLEYGLLLGGDFVAQRQQHKMLKVDSFNSVKKKMSVLVTLPDGRNRAFCKGASEIILKMCDKIVNSNGEPVLMSDEQVRNVTDVINSFASEALRTLCLAFKDMDDTFDENSIPDSGYTLITVVGIKDPVRPGVKEAVRTCLEAGITVRMVTGDNINTAKAIARECGILTEDGLAIEGPDFCSKSPEELKDIVPRIQVMAQSLPLDKHKLVTYLRETKEVVAVTGDGTNDAPALHEADIGLAMDIAGTEVAKENADVIILDDNFKTIVNVAKWGRAVYINIQKFVQFQLTVNVVALMINFVSACISGSAPLTAVQLLWVTLIMDTLGALALATEPPNDGLMNRPPIGRGESFITNSMWRNVIGQSIYQLIVLGVLNFDGKNVLGLEGPDATVVLNTFIFNTFVFCQVFNEINSLEMDKINVFRGMFNSWVFVAAMVATVTFQVIIVEFLGTFASTVPLSWQLWLLSVLIGSVSMLVTIVLKCFPVEKKAPKHRDGYEPIPSGLEMA